MKYTFLIALAGVSFAANAGFGQTSITITNPSFESPTVSSGSYDLIYLGTTGTTTSAVPGWSVTGKGDIVSLQNPGTPLVNQDGHNIFEDTSSSPYTGGASLSQVLTATFTPGMSYLLTAYAGTYAANQVAQGNPGAANAPLVNAYFYIANTSGQILASTTITGTTPGTLTAFTVPLDSNGTFGDTGQIVIGYSDSATQNGSTHLELDNFSLTEMPTPVPEPGSMAVAALGGFGVLGAVLRRRRA